MKGYLTNEAQVVGVESRTSSPVKIPRDKDSLEHPVMSGLFPCGEGAGYAGGIVPLQWTENDARRRLHASWHGIDCSDKRTSYMGINTSLRSGSAFEFGIEGSTFSVYRLG